MEKTVISFHNFVTLTGSEIECVYSMRNSEYVRKNCDNSSVFSYESHLKFVSGLKGNNSKRYYLIKIDWQPCGVYNLFDIDMENSSAKTGIFIVEDFSRYSFDIGVLSINILDKYNINNLISSVHKDNTRALLLNLVKFKAKIISETDSEYILRYTFNRNTLKQKNQEYDFKLIDSCE